MTLRTTLFAIGALLLCRVGGLAQGLNAQDRTQSFLDDHKSADVINPDRALTDKIRQPRVSADKSTLPPLTGVPDAKRAIKRPVSAKRILDLRKQRNLFVANQLDATKKARAGDDNAQLLIAPNAVKLKDAQVKKLADETWDKTKSGKELRKLESRGERGSFLPPLSK
jgi:hypothetical protein